MPLLRKTVIWFIFLITTFAVAQKSEIYTDEMAPYNHAVQLYQNKDYYAAQILFKNLKNTFDDSSELKARCYYYEAFCSIKTGYDDGEALMKAFVDRFPTSTKRNHAFLEVGDYYFNNANYPYALKWYSRVNEKNLYTEQKEDFQFRFAYGLFATRNYEKSKSYFSPLLNSPKYGSDAKYYYGYMAYRDDDYVNADKYLSQAAEDKKDKDIPYFMANIKFKTGKFEEAIELGVPLYAESNGIQKSEVAKIVGESYFNLEEYAKAIPYLESYEGKKGRLNNTDYYLLGYAYYKQKDYTTAISYFNKIIDGNNSVSQNAYYHLGECYLRTESKAEALNAFRNASQMDFDKTIQQDAALNYAKLSYDIGNPYQSVAKVIQDYLNKYPTDVNKDELNSLIVNSYISSKDYQGALNFLEDNPESEDFLKVAYLRGTQLFKQQKYTEAKQLFEMAQKKDNPFLAETIFWHAESDFRLGNYEKALEGFEKFIQTPGAMTSQEYKLIDYHKAYAYFDLKDYNLAGGHFDRFIESNPDSSELLSDAYLRLGDCYFSMSNYYKALKPYQLAVAENNQDADKASFKIALSQGLLGENDQKIAELNNLLNTYLRSPLRDDALFELGNTYSSINQNSKAIEAYDDLLKQFPNSNLVSKSMVKQGLIYYNTDQNDLALAKYKKVVQDFPNTPEAREAIANARQVYVDLGRVSEYEKLVKGIDYIDVSSSDIENTLYESAEKQLVSNNAKKAIQGFEDYLKRFPKGQFALPAHDNLGRIYESEGDKKKAISHYTALVQGAPSDYSENALLRLSEIYLKDNNFKEAMPLLERLERGGSTKTTIDFAQSNLMKGNYALNNYDVALNYANTILENPELDPKIKSDAEIIIARSAFKSGDFITAQDAFKRVEENATGELKAEAIYYDGYFLHQEGNYKNSNQVIQKLASDYANYKYWGAKGLVIMAKNFYALEDLYQATYILESVIKNFSNYPDITEEAKVELQKIKTEAKKTNESVIQNN